MEATIALPRDATIAEELEREGDVVLEMANLIPEQTGVDGIVFISTKMASHGPRVKFFLKAGRNQPSFSVSISDAPEIVASSVDDRILRQYAPSVIDFVKLNQIALADFWFHGDEWTDPQVQAMKQALVKVR